MDDNPRCSTCSAPAVVTLTLHGDNVPGEQHYCRHHWQRFAGLLAQVGKLNRTNLNAGSEPNSSTVLRILKGGKRG